MTFRPAIRRGPFLFDKFHKNYILFLDIHLQEAHVPAGIDIYSAEAGDARQIQEVFYATWLATYPNKEAGITEDDIHDHFRKKLTEERIAELAQHLNFPNTHDMLLAAKEGEKVVGLCRAGDNTIEADYNRLTALYVLPEYQRRGIGTALWESAKQLFDPRKPVRVGVAPYNLKARAFYEKLGFSVVSEVATFNPNFRMKSGNMIPSIWMKLPVEDD
jgi:ribosomal protein S18 acetylase RimI-like enzyme